MPLLPLKTQELFESLWFHDAANTETTSNIPEGMRPTDGAWLMYHTATWCKPCQRLQPDMPALVAKAESMGLTVWKVDQDENEYTSGYCGVRAIPTWQLCVPRKIVATLQSADVEKVFKWLDDHAVANQTANSVGANN